MEKLGNDLKIATDTIEHLKSKVDGNRIQNKNSIADLKQWSTDCFESNEWDIQHLKGNINKADNLFKKLSSENKDLERQLLDAHYKLEKH